MLEWLSTVHNFYEPAKNQTQIFMQILSVIICTVSLNFVFNRTILYFEKISLKSKTYWDDALLEALRLPLRAVTWVIGVSISIELMRNMADSEILSIFDSAREVVFVLIFAWFLNRFITLAEKNIVDPNLVRKPMDGTTASAVGKVLRISVTVTTALVVMQTLGYSVSGVLAFGGIGGMAVGFAAKDLLANFFGGLMIYMDRPFSVGDWVRSPDRNIEGTIEDIGWRLTRIRTFDKRPLYVPNAVFTSIAVENPSRMKNRRIYETLGIRYADIAQMRSIVSATKLMLQEHADIDSSQTLIVNFDAFSESSVDFFVYTFTKTTDWVKYHDIKQDVLLKIEAIISSHGSEMAFPTRTLHIENGTAK